ncbi:hypothetical protein ABPG73_008946 [Tetrahymena malaccensis]
MQIPELLNQLKNIEQSKKLINQDTDSQQDQRILSEDNNYYYKIMNQSKQPNIQMDQSQYQLEFNYLRNQMKKNTLKSELVSKKIFQNRFTMSKQSSNAFQRQANEGLIKQLKELVQTPLKTIANEDFLFETLKSYSIYMPHNNCERVLLLYSVLMGSNKPLLYVNKTKQSTNKNEESQLNLKPQSQFNKSKKSILHYQNLLRQNQIDSNLDINN